MATEKATLGGGCFWCLEAVFQRLDGVHTVVSGYAGGATENPTYREVCSGRTGHAEVVQISFDPEKISYQELLSWFWRAHDPTTPNRQGADVGTQYRSIILADNQKQLSEANQSRVEAQNSGMFASPIVTEIEMLTRFYPAEVNHQNYYNDHRAAPYCAAVIVPKLAKLDLDL